MAHFNEEHIAFFEACEEGNVETVSRLLEEGRASVDLPYPHGFGFTPIMKACQYGQPAMAKFLIEKGAILSGVKSEAGLTPLAFAIKGRNIEVYHILRAAGAEPHGVQSHYQRTLLHQAAEDNEEEFIKVLLSDGVEVDALDADQRTPLHLACWWGRTEAIDLLHSAGASLTPQDRHNKTPPGYLKQQGFKDLYAKYNALSPSPELPYGEIPGLRYLTPEEAQAMVQEPAPGSSIEAALKESEAAVYGDASLSGAA